jgi:hypothetical protein
MLVTVATVAARHVVLAAAVVHHAVLATVVHHLMLATMVVLVIMVATHVAVREDPHGRTGSPLSKMMGLIPGTVLILVQLPTVSACN